MDNHPIPQDVTGFQFKLIGDMTVKQFAYVAVGAILAFVCFYAPVSPFIKLPIGVIFGLFGAALAFLPLEGRPVDAMVSYFIKALVTPNQYAYHKTGGSIALFTVPALSHTPSATTANAAKHTTVDEEKVAQLQQYLQSVQKHSTSPLDEKEQLFLEHALTTSTQTTRVTAQTPISTTPVPPLPSAGQPKKVDAPLSPREMEEEEANLALQAASIKYELNEAKEHEAKEKDTAKITTTHQQVVALEQKLSQLLTQKEEIEKELSILKAATAPTTQPSPQPTTTSQSASSPQPSTEQIAAQVAMQITPAQPQPPTPPVIPAAPTVHKIPADMAKSIGLPRMPDVPNLIVGIVKDPRGNILQNILVEVKDKNGIPARAFRTNSLGQFASATQLSNGSYTIVFEDPKNQHIFDVVEIIAEGAIMLPLEIISHDEREDLRKALFS